MHQFDAIFQNLNEELSKIEKDELGMIPYTAECISICHNYLQVTRDLVSRRDFRSETEEIHFFKKIKPAILAKLYYHVYVHQFNLKLPLLAANTLVRHYEQHLEAVGSYSEKNKVFVDYMAADSSYLDKEFFLRYSSNYRLNGDPLAFHLDPAFSTYYDIKAGEYLGQEEFRAYLASGLHALQNPEINQPGAPVVLKWTDGIVSLVELIYALHSNKSINNGKTKIGEITAGFAKLFGIKLEMKDVYRAYTEIKGRKSGMRFLDSLKHAIELRIRKGLKFK